MNDICALFLIIIFIFFIYFLNKQQKKILEELKNKMKSHKEVNKSDAETISFLLFELSKQRKMIPTISFKNKIINLKDELIIKLKRRLSF